MSLAAVPERPANVNPVVVNKDKLRSFVVADSYTLSQRRILASTLDDIETEISLRAYDNMEKDSTITKCKRILITSVLSDDLQMSPGATEDEVSKSEFKTYETIMQFCERVIEGLDSPYRQTAEQQLGNAIKYGHGIGEIEWEYRKDAPPTRPEEKKAPKGRISAAFSKIVMFFTSEPIQAIEAAEGTPTKPVLKQTTRLMPKSIKIKPRGATRFVVDDYMNVLGLIPTHKSMAGLNINEIVDRDKFTILTLNKQDEDPRGRSMYRPAINWYNLKTQLPGELLRFILEEIVPKAVGTLPPDMPAFEFERDENGNIVYENPDAPASERVPKMLTGAESFKRQIEGFRSGGGAVIPNGATLKPYKSTTGSGDADIFTKTIKTVDDQIQDAILNQTLAQSEGEHQARSAAQQVAEVLYNLVFWIKWQLAMVTLYDVLGTAVRVNFGDWAVRYLPFISFGDFVRRDWVKELEALADAYFKGLLDDSQRPELMTWLNLPKPGPSRQEMGLEAAAKQDVNGQPGQPNNNRPDKQPGTNNRNAGNGTEKKNANKQKAEASGRGTSDFMGHHRGWFGRFKSYLRTGPRS